MVAARVSRTSIEVGALASSVAGVTRLDAEVATPSQQATSGDVRVSRVSIEVLGPRPVTASVTRLDAEVATPSQQATSGDVRVSRVSIEAGARVIRRASVTRLDAEVATPSREATTAVPVRLTRVSFEALARRGAAGAVSPLALADGIEVFLHNWVDEAVLSTSYLTDVSTSPNTGAESRRGLVLKPSRSMDLVWHFHAKTDDEFARLRLDRFLVMLRKLTDEQIAIPLYMDQRDLASSYLSTDDEIFFDTTKARFFSGARVVIVQLDLNGSYASHSFHLISSVESTKITLTADLGIAVPAGSVIIPMIDCKVMLEAKAKYFTARNVAVKLSVEEIEGASQLPPVKSDLPSNTSNFDDKPVLDYDPDWISGMEKGRIRHGQKYRQGRADRVYAAAERSREWHKIELTGLRGSCASSIRDDIWRVVEFFDTRRGRLRGFWHIDQEQVWDAESIDPSGTFIGVDEINDLASFSEELADGWVGLVMKDGTFYVREVVTVQQVLTTFRITVTPSLPASLDVNDVLRVARARASRFDKDEMVERWKHTGYMGTSLEIIETLEEKNVET